MFTCLHHLLANIQHKTPDAIALYDKQGAVSYQQLGEQVSQQARALRAIGMARRQRVGLFLPKQVEMVSSLLAVSQAGGVFVPINPVLKSQQLSHILNDCNVGILLTTVNRFQSLQEALCGCPDLNTVILVDAEVYEPQADKLQILGWQEFIDLADDGLLAETNIETDMVAILYTSGSTGNAKGVVLSHRNLIAGAESVASYLHMQATDRLLAVLPFSFDYGLNQLTTSLLTGASCVLMDYLLPNDVIQAVGKYRVSGLAGVPSLWIQLAELSWPDSINSHLRYMTNSGGSLPVAVLRKLRSKAPKSHFFLMYGLTEAFRSTYLSPEQLDRRPTSIGKAVPNAEIMVISKDGRPCLPHQPGELVHRGPLVSMGYWNDPVSTAKCFKPAPLQLPGLPLPEIAVWSGDTVTMDEEGYLYFAGRKDDMIKTSGYRVSPDEIEAVVYASGLVKEAAAIGIAHPQLGQAVLLVVSVNAGISLDPQLLLAHCKWHLPNFMLPAKIEVMAALPGNANGKIDRQLLGQQFSDLFNANEQADDAEFN